jgi:hypothetical protein
MEGVVRIPVIIEIPEEGIEQLRSLLGDPGGSGGGRDAPPALSGGDVELPQEWDLVDTRSGVRYTWGEDHDIYDPFLVYEGKTSGGITKLAIGKCKRTRTHGRDRVYYIVVAIGPEGGMRAIAEFLATDDYERTREVIAIIKGKEGSGRQFDSADELPAVYGPWETVTYRERVDYPGSYLKQGVICGESDHEAMLNHSLAQIELRDLV